MFPASHGPLRPMLSRKDPLIVLEYSEGIEAVRRSLVQRREVLRRASDLLTQKGQKRAFLQRAEVHTKQVWSGEIG